VLSDSGEVDRSSRVVATLLGAKLGSQPLLELAGVSAETAKLLRGLGFCLVGQGGFEPPTT